MEIKYITKHTAYKDVIEMQKASVEDVLNGSDEVLFIAEHDDIFTLGTSSDTSDILDKSIKTIDVGRGGKITYHGPGQIVIYPIIDLSKNLNSRGHDLNKYIKNLELVISKVLNELGVQTVCSEHTGVWVLDNGVKCKIAAIGIRCKRWVTYFGVALNANVDLENFNKIVPCGINQTEINKNGEIERLGVTSLKNLGINTSPETLNELIIKNFKLVFEIN